MYMNVAPDQRKLPVVIPYDSIFCICTFSMALFVGYVGNWCLTQTPKMSEDPSNQEATSLVLTALFVMGQATGSTLSYVLVQNIL